MLTWLFLLHHAVALPEGFEFPRLRRTEITLSYNPRFKPRDYVTHALRQIPLSQYDGGGPTIRLSGYVQITLHNRIAREVEAELAAAFDGQTSVSGTKLDTTRAAIWITREPFPDEEEPPTRIFDPEDAEYLRFMSCATQVDK